MVRLVEQNKEWHIEVDLPFLRMCVPTLLAKIGKPLVRGLLNTAYPTDSHVRNDVGPTTSNNWPQCRAQGYGQTVQPKRNGKLNRLFFVHSYRAWLARVWTSTAPAWMFNWSGSDSYLSHHAFLAVIHRELQTSTTASQLQLQPVWTPSNSERILIIRFD